MDANVHFSKREKLREMILIITADKPKCTTITVGGQVSGDYVDTIETCCA